jgi:hypothetical protein
LRFRGGVLCWHCCRHSAGQPDLVPPARGTAEGGGSRRQADAAAAAANLRAVPLHGWAHSRQLLLRTRRHPHKAPPGFRPSAKAPPQALDVYRQACARRGIIGHPVMLDAAQFGSLTHRVRNYWTNLCAATTLCCCLACSLRPAHRTVSLALGPGRNPQPVRVTDQFPPYVCNTPGAPMQAWPTLMAHPSSYAFRPGQPCSVSTIDGEYTQPTTHHRAGMCTWLPKRQHRCSRSHTAATLQGTR